MTGGPLIYTRRRIRDRLLMLLASDSVRPFVVLYYVAFFIWGVYGSIIAYPINLIVDPMGLQVYDLWVWTPLVATQVALGGLALRHGGSPANEIHGALLRRDFLGLWMQVGGHACMAVVLGVYIAAGTIGAEWGQGQPVISVFLFTPYFLGASFLAAQCFYKIRLGRRR